MSTTTLKLKKETKARLDHLKEYKRETYDDVLEKMLGILNICRFNPERARAKLVSIDRQKRRQSRQTKLQKANL
ncbi:MAG TPA: hypothetical protein VI544_00630 [Candidatus Nanoarchaeia archaeon]|nr:hypothetical protein [Candidatus Nanoarchaeia archaeon]